MNDKRYDLLAHIAYGNYWSPTETFEIIHRLLPPMDQLLELLIAEGSKDLRRIIAEYHDLPREIIEKLAADDHHLVRVEIAKNKKTPPEVLRKLAVDDYYLVRKIVANNPNTPADVLLLMADDEDLRVIASLLSNEKTPEKVLRHYAETHFHEEKLMRGIAQNPRTPADLLSPLVDYPCISTREWLARNPNTPLDVLQKLAEDDYVAIRLAARNAIAKKTWKN